jgi:hypothetical protein
MAYQIVSGQIQGGILYQVAGAQSVIYNSVTYTTGQRFKGIATFKTFTYSGSGSQEVNEVLELNGGAIEYVATSLDNPFFTDTIVLKGMTVEFVLSDGDRIINESTKMQGFAIEFTDYPFYSFQITETRL